MKNDSSQSPRRTGERCHRLAAVAMGVALAASCGASEEKPPKPPYFIVDKNIFRSERIWFVTSTVRQVPYWSTEINGDEEVNDIVRWSIERDYLVGRRAYSPVLGAGETRADPTYAFPILRHVDVWKGQLVDSPKKAWHEKQYMEIDWAINRVPRYGNFEQAGMPYAPPPFTPVSYQIEYPEAERFTISDDYVEVPVRLTLAEPYASDPTHWSAPVCSVNGYDTQLCAPSELLMVRSMFPQPEDDQYEPVVWSDTLQAQFPMFRKVWLYADPRFGRTDAGRRQFTYAFDIWKRVRDEQGRRIPVRERELVPIVFYLSANFPDRFKPDAQAVMDVWDDALRDAINGRRYWDCRDAAGGHEGCLAERNIPRVLKLCIHNPVREGDDPDCGPPGRTVTVWDRRYNTIDWSTDAYLSDPSGLSMAKPHPETGRIVSAQVYLKERRLKTFLYEFAQMLQLFNGDQQVDAAYLRGEDVASLVRAIFSADDPFGGLRQGLDSSAPVPVPLAPQPLPPPTPEDLRSRWSRMSLPDELARLPPIDLSGFAAFQASRRARLTSLGALVPGAEAWEAKRQQLWGTTFEKELIDRDALAVAALAAPFVSREELAGYASPLRSRTAPLAMGPFRLDFGTQFGLDPILLKLAMQHKGRSLDEIVEALWSRGLRSILIHEIGHAFGMRHNFAGTADPLNFGPDYWRLRSQAGAPQPRWRAPMTAAEADAGLLEHAVSSVMDYPATLLEFPMQLGRYDRAVLKYIYGGLVEVFDSPQARANAALANQLSLANLWARGSVPLLDQGRLRGVHYTEYPTLFGDLEARSDVPVEKLVDFYGMGMPLAMPDGRPVVPYRGCSDDWVDMFPGCFMDDRGADAYESALDRINRYRAYYVNTHFRRGFLGRGAPNLDLYMSYYRTVLVEHLLAVLDLGAEAGRMASEDGLLATTAALSEGFDFLAQVITLPEPGSYALEARPAAPSFYAWRGPPGAGGVEVALGRGRHYATLYDAPSTGQDFLERVRYWGSALDKREALRALLEPISVPLPGGAVPDTRIFTAGISNVYPDPVNELIGGILSADHEALGPAVDAAGELVFRRWTREGASWPPAGLSMLDPSLPYSTRKVARTLALANSGAWAGDHLANSFRITVVGLDDYATSQPTVVFEDSDSGRQYRAQSMVSDGRETGIGARVLLRARALQAAASDAAASAGQRAAARAELAGFVQEIEQMHQLSRALELKYPVR